MKINTQNELAALMLGVILGRDLEFAEEWRTEHSIAFGDFEASSLIVDKTGTLEPNTVGNLRDNYAMVGAMNEAEKDAAEIWAEWKK